MGMPEEAAETVVLAGVFTAGEVPGKVSDEGVHWVERGWIPFRLWLVFAKTGIFCFSASIKAFA